MQKYEEKRKERLNEAKSKDKDGHEVHKATTIYHGNNTDSSGRSVSKFVDPPNYLRNQEHSCFIPKKWVHTWSGHNQGVQKI
mmetsp:Transcript_22898/g.16201  ORF Transcript_22898/g.16201 Transcript_22898/m.16201 type:complete len:82 (+) Transcript_22898:629-874(+)